MQEEQRFLGSERCVVDALAVGSEGSQRIERFVERRFRCGVLLQKRQFLGLLRQAAIVDQLRDLYSRCDDRQARMATAVALLHHKMPHFFWTGFYRLLGGKLKVGPYQGGHGCLVIPFDRGVCGKCATEEAVQNVPDVEALPYHIACAATTRSELVLPVHSADGALLAVLGMAVLSTSLAYLLYFRILARAGATNLLLVTFLIPVSAILLGVMVLGERPGWNAFGGMALIFVGLIAIDGRLVKGLKRPSG